MYYNNFCINFIKNVNNKKTQTIPCKQMERFQCSHHFDKIDLWIWLSPVIIKEEVLVSVLAAPKESFRMYTYEQMWYFA